ncbi:MAG: type VI secretion system baseplate subunit TssG [candidate division Zixibacteria bacterium]|nr:type VI secretion system baseplate subunit TssG [candidate division Zixibacteria bacterium]
MQAHSRAGFTNGHRCWASTHYCRRSTREAGRALRVHPYQGPSDQEGVRLRPSTSLTFPPGDIESVERIPGELPRYDMTVAFMGLYGAHSPLPGFYAEQILHRADEDDPIRSFLDIFNHRLLSLLTRGLLKFRGHMMYQPDASDEYSWRLFALSGLGADADPSQAGVPSAHLLRFAGLFCQKPRSAAAVASMLRTYFEGLPVRVHQCVRRWFYLPAGLQCLLGRNSCRLGDDATIGERTSDRMGKFRVAVGPVDFDSYCEFLPGREKLTTMRNLAKLACPDWLDFDIEVTLRGDMTPRLGVTLSKDSHLGWTTGLFSEPSADVSVVFA